MEYKILTRQTISAGNYSIVPIRMEDRYYIMRWRNEQMYHLRQNKPLTKEEQDRYFEDVVSKLFNQDKPDQILFSYLEGEKCIGYGGLVHINWIDRNAEISFLIATSLENEGFEKHWTTFLMLIEGVAFKKLNLHKIYTYAFDIREHLYKTLYNTGYNREAVLKEHGLIDGKFVNVIIHSKISNSLILRNANDFDVEQTFIWVNDPIIRKYSFSKEKVDFHNHKRWFLEKIKSDQCEYYVLETNSIKLGSIRFDREQEGNYLISFLIDPAFSGKGLGTTILQLGVDRLISVRDDVKVVYGLVHIDNIASVKIFEKLNYTQKAYKPNIFMFQKVI